MSDSLFDLVSGIPGAMGQIFGNLAQNIQGIRDDAEQLGETEIDVAGPEEDSFMETGEIDETGAPKRRRIRTRKAKATKVKAASPATKQAASSLDGRVKRIESDLKSLAGALKSKGVMKVAGSGNRAMFTATVLATAAGAAVTPANVVGNADQQYDRAAFQANTPSLLSAITVAGNPLLDGNQSVPVDVFAIGPVELAEPVKLNGNAGLGLTHTNRGAAAGDAGVLMIPIGHSWGCANPGSF